MHLIGRFGIDIVVVDGCREDADELALSSSPWRLVGARGKGLRSCG
jgi:hypothetical protein